VTQNDCRNSEKVGNRGKWLSDNGILSEVRHKLYEAPSLFVGRFGGDKTGETLYNACGREGKRGGLGGTVVESN